MFSPKRSYSPSKILYSHHALHFPQNVKQKDAGTYKVVLKNESGEVNAKVKLDLPDEAEEESEQQEEEPAPKKPKAKDSKKPEKAKAPESEPEPEPEPEVVEEDIEPDVAEEAETM